MERRGKLDKKKLTLSLFLSVSHSISQTPLPLPAQPTGLTWKNLTQNSKGRVASFWDFDWGASLKKHDAGAAAQARKNPDAADPTVLATAYESKNAMKGAYPGWDVDLHFISSDSWFARPHQKVAACGNQIEVVGSMLYVATPASCPTHPDGRPRPVPRGAGASNVVLYTSADEGRSFSQACLPSKDLDLGYSLLRTHDERAALLVVDHDEREPAAAAAPVGNVYAPGDGDAAGAFSLSLPRAYRAFQASDVARVEGLPGVWLANQLDEDAMVGGGGGGRGAGGGGWPRPPRGGGGDGARGGRSSSSGSSSRGFGADRYSERVRTRVTFNGGSSSFQGDLFFSLSFSRGGGRGGVEIDRKEVERYFRRRENLAGWGKNSRSFYFSSLSLVSPPIPLHLNKQTNKTGGGAWKDLSPPRHFTHAACARCTPSSSSDSAVDSSCAIHLHGPSSWHDGPSGRPAFYSHSSAPGVVIAVGNAGPHLDSAADSLCTWLSRDGGRSWQDVAPRASIYEFGNSGGIILSARHEADGPTDTISFSADGGELWWWFHFEPRAFLRSSSKAERGKKMGGGEMLTFFPLLFSLLKKIYRTLLPRDPALGGHRRPEHPRGARRGGARLYGAFLVVFFLLLFSESFFFPQKKRKRRRRRKLTFFFPLFSLLPQTPYYLQQVHGKACRVGAHQGCTWEGSGGGGGGAGGAGTRSFGAPGRMFVVDVKSLVSAASSPPSGSGSDGWRECQKSDYEDWHPAIASGGGTGGCLLGADVSVKRKVPGVHCFNRVDGASGSAAAPGQSRAGNTDGTSIAPSADPSNFPKCQCTDDDVECEFGYEPVSGLGQLLEDAFFFGGDSPSSGNDDDGKSGTRQKRCVKVPGFDDRSACPLLAERGYRASRTGLRLVHDDVCTGVAAVIPDTDGKGGNGKGGRGGGFFKRGGFLHAFSATVASFSALAFVGVAGISLMRASAERGGGLDGVVAALGAAAGAALDASASVFNKARAAVVGGGGGGSARSGASDAYFQPLSGEDDGGDFVPLAASEDFGLDLGAADTREAAPL